ncbi:hypothetical protein AMR41_28910 [Hapalosiphon sp. MRB220]|nr:hypothetical protein AMR41_28910 [Hapalosiphon sp. MRB220]
MIQFFAKMGMGIVGSVIAGPLGGAAAYALSDLVLDEESKHLTAEELATKFAVKFLILATGGAVAGMAGEALGSAVGVSVDGISEMIVPGDVSNKIAEFLVSNEAVADLFNQVCNFTENSCLPEEVKADLMRNYFDKFEELIYTLINDEVMDEIVGREITKPLANKSAQNLLEKLKSDLGPYAN